MLGQREEMRHWPINRCQARQLHLHLYWLRCSSAFRCTQGLCKTRLGQNAKVGLIRLIRLMTHKKNLVDLCKRDPRTTLYNSVPVDFMFLWWLFYFYVETVSHLPSWCNIGMNDFPNQVDTQVEEWCSSLSSTCFSLILNWSAISCLDIEVPCFLYLFSHTFLIKRSLDLQQIFLQRMDTVFYCRAITSPSSLSVLSSSA